MALAALLSHCQIDATRVAARGMFADEAHFGQRSLLLESLLLESSLLESVLLESVLLESVLLCALCCMLSGVACLRNARCSEVVFVLATGRSRHPAYLRAPFLR